MESTTDTSLSSSMMECIYVDVLIITGDYDAEIKKMKARRM
jgi:hypothetical protein